MALAIGWYGPLIDLASASCHVDQFVQLIVFVRLSQPIHRENGASKGSFLKTLIQVGDETRANFDVSIWSKSIGSTALVGDFILLQNVKVVKFRERLEAVTDQVSAIQVLLHSSKLTDLTAGKGEMAINCKLGQNARAKLKRAVNWVLSTESALHQIKHVVHQTNNNKENKAKSLMQVSEILCLTDSCDTCFVASIGGEVVLQFYQNAPRKERFPITRRLLATVDNAIIDDFTVSGCKLCGLPLDSRNLSGENSTSSLKHCVKNPKNIHDISPIYRPFLLYAWDQGLQIPVLVRNEAAEMLFGNITANKVFKCYKEDMKKQSTKSNGGERNPNFHKIWVILLKSIFCEGGKNSPFRFEIRVDAEKDPGNGRFELVSFKLVHMQCK